MHCRGETDIQKEDKDIELNEDEAPPPPILKSLKEAMHNLEAVRSYLDDSGYFTEVSDCQRLLCSVTQLHLRARSERQSFLNEFYDSV